VIEVEVIPRLLVAQFPVLVTSEPVAGATIDPGEVDRIADLAVTLEAHELLNEVEQFVTRGVCIERVLVDLMAPAARALGDAWKRDDLDFVEVTMALWRLQEVLRELAGRSPPTGRMSADPRGALFSPVPGDQHSFGTAMIEECFARAGWDTDLMIDPTRGDLLARLGNRRFDLLGLTLSNDCHIAQLSSLIRAIRNVSRNPNICVMLGGRALIERPAIATEVGADGTAPSALDALDLADRLIDLPLRTASA
jgi:methanogenic corrinoid protein MtbC1